MTTGTNNSEKVKRSIFLRILYSILWFIPCWFIFSLILGAIIGGIVGGLAATDVTTYSEGAAVGGKAATEFMSKYGIYVNLSAILIWLVLSIVGILPGTSKYKRLKS